MVLEVAPGPCNLGLGSQDLQVAAGKVDDALLSGLQVLGTVDAGKVGFALGHLGLWPGADGLLDGPPLVFQVVPDEPVAVRVLGQDVLHLGDADGQCGPFLSRGFADAGGGVQEQAVLAPVVGLGKGAGLVNGQGVPVEAQLGRL